MIHLRLNKPYCNFLFPTIHCRAEASVDKLNLPLQKVLKLNKNFSGIVSQSEKKKKKAFLIVSTAASQ